MTYLITINHQGDPETYRKIVERVEAHTDGLIARFAGMNERGLAITAIWESKAHSDRFAAEHLMPAIRDLTVGGEPGPGLVVEFDTFDDFRADSAA